MTYTKPFAGICLATTVFVCTLMGVPALPGNRPAATGLLQLGAGQGTQPATLVVGTPLPLAAGGFLPGAAVTIGLYSDPVTLGTATANASGVVTTTIIVPNILGDHTLVALGNDPTGGTNSPQAGVRIVAASTRSSVGSLAVTGFDVLLLAGAGIAAIVCGFLLTRTYMRRSRTPVS